MCDGGAQGGGGGGAAAIERRHVARGGEEGASRGHAAAPAAPNLLDVAIKEVVRHAYVDDLPDAALVDAQPKGAGGDHYVHLAREEVGQHTRALRIRLLDGVRAPWAVVGLDHEVRVVELATERGEQQLRVLRTRDVDERRSAVSSHELDHTPTHLICRARLELPREVQVGPIDRLDREQRRVQLEHVDNVAAHVRRGGGGERKEGNTRHALPQPPELTELSPEGIVRLGDAMGLIHSYELQPQIRVPALHQLDEAR